MNQFPVNVAHHVCQYLKWSSDITNVFEICELERKETAELRLNWIVFDLPRCLYTTLPFYSDYCKHVKPVYVPLPFWFNQDPGSSLPGWYVAACNPHFRDIPVTFSFRIYDEVKNSVE